MNSGNIFKILASFFRAEGVRALLIGGYAVNSYKVTRHTADIDFMVTQSDLDKTEAFLSREGYGRKNSHSVFVQLAAEGRRDIDFMISDDETFERMWSRSRDTTIAGEKFRVPHIHHLIALKLHSIKYNPHRELLDYPDIVHLVQANGIDVESPEIKSIFSKHAPSGLYEKLLEFIRK